MKCPVCQIDIELDREHWYGGTAKCPIRAYARQEDLEAEMANWGIESIHPKAVVRERRPIVVNLPLAIVLQKAPSDFAERLARVVRRL